MELLFDNWVLADICCYSGMHEAQTNISMSHLLLPYVCLPCPPFLQGLTDLYPLRGDVLNTTVYVSNIAMVDLIDTSFTALLLTLYRTGV